MRFLWRKRLFSGFNFLGLWVSYTALILIAIYLFRETNYESFHQKSERIFRVAHHTAGDNGFETHWARTYLDFVNQMPEEVPGISHLIRFQNHQRRFLKIGEQSYRPPHSYSTDAEVFEVFDFPLLHGDPLTALQEPHSIVLSESLARQYFGDQDPMGQTIEVMGEYNLEAQVHTVTGVMEDLPAHTHLPVDALLSFQNPEERSWWAYVYIMLEPGIKEEQVQSQLASFVASHQEENPNNQVYLELQALPNIHLDSHLAREIVPNGNRVYVHILLGVALFIWLIALINYLNLSSALSLQRQKEIGLHRVLGAEKSQLMRFAWFESMGFHAVASLISLGTAYLLMPWWESTTGIEWDAGWVHIGLLSLGIACVIGGLAGIYPASVLVKASTQQVFRADAKQTGRNAAQAAARFKRILIGVQFSAALLLMICAWIGQNQLRYLQNKSLGMEVEQVLAIPRIPNPVTDRYPAFRAQLEGIPGVLSVGACMEVPSREIRDVGQTFLGANADPADAKMMDIQVISPGYLETVGAELLAGEDLSSRYRFKDPPVFSESLTPERYFREQSRNYLINETAMRELGFAKPEEAVGQQISWSIGNFQLAPGPITGVVKDVHQETLKNEVDPTVMLVEQIWLRTFLLKLGTGDMATTIGAVEEVWQRLFPQYPFEYQFLDDLYDQLYRGERQQVELVISLTFLAVLIALIGLFGLVAYSLQLRRKELAIRRIVGASWDRLILLVSQEYGLALLISSLIAVPLSYYLLSQWLTNFAYHIEISVLSFLLPLCVLVFLVLLTIGFQVMRTKRQHPGEILREN